MYQLNEHLLMSTQISTCDYKMGCKFESLIPAALINISKIWLEKLYND